MPLGMKVGLSQGDFVLDENPAPSPKGGGDFYCGETAGCIKMSLSIEVGLSPGDFVLDGDPDPLPIMGQSPPPNFRPISIVAKRLDASRCHLVWR